MADIGKLKTFLDAYGVGVRAGVITPQISDEEYIRKLFELPEMSDAAKNAWNDAGGIRRPITLAQEVTDED